MRPKVQAPWKEHKFIFEPCQFIFLKADAYLHLSSKQV